MTRWMILLSLLVLIFPVTAYAASDDYLLAPGDVLSISVLGNDELTFRDPNLLAIRLDGKLAFPLVGDIQAAGLSASDFTKALTEQLKVYLVDPMVTVNVAKLHNTEICILGQVNRPGVYPLGMNHTLLEAIGAASGWTQDAAKTKVYIIRKNQKGEPLKVNLVQLLKHGDMNNNYTLNDGDVVYLTENNRINVANDILPFIYPVYLAHHWEKSPS